LLYFPLRDKWARGEIPMASTDEASKPASLEAATEPASVGAAAGGAVGAAVVDEPRRLRRLQIMVSMVMSVIGQDPNLTVEEASELVAGARRAALTMFPGKELAFDIIYKPRLQRLLRERFNVQ
jgi:hypothetical protein